MGTDHVSSNSQVDLRIRDMQILGNGIQSWEVDLSREWRERSCDGSSEYDETLLPFREGGVIFGFVFSRLGLGDFMGGGDFYALGGLGDLFPLDDLLLFTIFQDAFRLGNIVLNPRRRGSLRDIDIVLTVSGRGRQRGRRLLLELF